MRPTEAWDACFFLVAPNKRTRDEIPPLGKLYATLNFYKELSQVVIEAGTGGERIKRDLKNFPVYSCFAAFIFSV